MLMAVMLCPSRATWDYTCVRKSRIFYPMGKLKNETTTVSWMLEDDTRLLPGSETEDFISHGTVNIWSMTLFVSGPQPGFLPGSAKMAE